MRDDKGIVRAPTKDPTHLLLRTAAVLIIHFPMNLSLEAQLSGSGCSFFGGERGRGGGEVGPGINVQGTNGSNSFNC